jgi:hypothetical protein
MTQKTTQKIGLGLATFAMIALAACGKDGATKQDAGNLSDPDVSALGLLNTYTSDCQNVPGALLGLNTYKVKYEITGHMNKTTTYYATNDCQNEVLEIETQGEYSHVGQVANMDKVGDIDYSWKHTLITPKTADLVTAMNLIPGGYCGIQNWSLTATDSTPVQRSVTDAQSGSDLTCFGTTKLGAYYDLITTKDGNLRFGQSSLINDKSSNAKRPVAIDPTVIAHK